MSNTYKTAKATALHLLCLAATLPPPLWHIGTLHSQLGRDDFLRYQNWSSGGSELQSGTVRCKRLSSSNFSRFTWIAQQTNDKCLARIYYSKWDRSKCVMAPCCSLLLLYETLSQSHWPRTTAPSQEVKFRKVPARFCNSVIQYWQTLAVGGLRIGSTSSKSVTISCRRVWICCSNVVVLSDKWMEMIRNLPRKQRYSCLSQPVHIQRVTFSNLVTSSGRPWANTFRHTSDCLWKRRGFVDKTGVKLYSKAYNLTSSYQS